MTKFLKVTAMTATCAVAFCADVTPDAVLGFRLLSDANAVVGAPVTPGSVAGVARRTTRRTVAVASTSTATTSSAQAATTQQQSATAQQQSATAAQQSATAQQQTAAAQQQATAAQQPQAPPAAGQPLALGTVVAALPAGCTQMTSGGVQYSKCGANYYRAVFQGNNLVYVTAQP
jgi:hypothetical protein